MEQLNELYGTLCPRCSSPDVGDIIGSESKLKCRRCGHTFYRGDEVERPSHYMEGRHEVIEIIKNMLTVEEYMGYLKGNIIKYSCRAGLKGDRATDIAKRDKYMDFLSEILERGNVIDGGVKDDIAEDKDGCQSN